LGLKYVMRLSWIFRECNDFRLECDTFGWSERGSGRIVVVVKPEMRVWLDKTLADAPPLTERQEALLWELLRPLREMPDELDLPVAA
jgi:hypothetical protein